MTFANLIFNPLFRSAGWNFDHERKMIRTDHFNALLYPLHLILTTWKSWKQYCHVLDIAYSFLFFFFPPLFNLFQLFIYRFREKLIKICFRPFELSGINLDIHIDFEEKYFSQIRIYFLWNLSFLIYV